MSFFTKKHTACEAETPQRNYDHMDITGNIHMKLITAKFGMVTT